MSERRDRGPTEWHIITSEYPPAIGGVSDYTFTIARALAKTATVHVWCPAEDSAHPAQPGVWTHTVETFGPRQLRRLGRDLATFAAPRRLLVQWTPQGFGFHSLNIGFSLWLAWRAFVKNDAVDVMVHEPYLPWSRRPARFVAALLHRMMLAVACSAATRVWVSTSTWSTYVRPYVRSRVPIRWLPVPAPALTTDHRARPGRRAADEPVVGHFGMHSPLITPMLALALDEVLKGSTASILLIGRGSDLFRAAFVETRPAAADRVRATGSAAPDDIHAALLTCDLMLQPYPDGVTARRTSMLTTMALAVPVVTNTGTLTEPFWHDLEAMALVDGPRGADMGRRAVQLLAHPDERKRLGSAGRASYERLFAVERAAALLRD